MKRFLVDVRQCLGLLAGVTLNTEFNSILKLKEKR